MGRSEDPWDDSDTEEEPEVAANNQNEGDAPPGPTTPVNTASPQGTGSQHHQDEDSTTGPDGLSLPSRDLGPRVRHPPSNLSIYDCSFSDIDWWAMVAKKEDPQTYEEAATDEKWREAMKQEIAAIIKNNTWILTSLPAGVIPIGVKWVFRTKLKEEGSVDKFKARLVAKGYSQQHGIDYTEVFAPVARWDTIRTFLALAAHHGLTVFQLDVKSAFSI
ncbi:unnamed protein product [Linum trigynum]|uniref:Reverse transcriptase Ty1/copia-type domain-containing protein n=1 Tax=Linum trigynum TaxID=586398 RepID=A0AAV2GDT6_9ROSI